MSVVSLQRSAILPAAILSFIVHVTLFGLIFVMRQANHFVMPSPYVVSLVGPETAVKSRAAEREETPERNAVETREAGDTPKAVSRSEERYLSERIAALEAKKRIERIVKLRGVISLKAGKGDRKIVSGGAQTAKGTGSLVDDYASRVGEEIRQQWAFPDTGDRNIEAIVSMRIQKNGSLQILGIEKSSGNPLFDRSALRAITKASPVTPPPYEMEIGVRFYP